MSQRQCAGAQLRSLGKTTTTVNAVWDSLHWKEEYHDDDVQEVLGPLR